MNTPASNKPTTHPMMIAAAIAIVLFCLAGTAAIMGWIPSSVGSAASEGELSASDRAALASRLADTDNKAAAPRVAERAPAPRKAVRDEPVRAAQAAPARNWCGNCGNVESVREVTTRAKGSGLGAAGGAVLGGLLGNQIGDGSGRKIATVAGAVGGAVVGNQVEGNMKATRSYEVRVRLDDGSSRTFTQQSANWSTGDRVKIVDGQLRSAG